MFNSGMDLLHHTYFHTVQHHRHGLDTSLGYRNDSTAESSEIFQPEEVFAMKKLQLGTINQPKKPNYVSHLAFSLDESEETDN